MVTLQTLQDTLVLPNPSFSDVQSQRIEVQVRRSMNNTRRTYVKTNDRHALTYSFLMSRPKSVQAEAFIDNSFDSEITLTNHKDEIWKVRLVNNPFEFNFVGRGEYSNITFQFEGIQQ